MKALLPLLLILPVSAQEADSPEALYRKMEEKLLAAKTLTIKAQVKLEGDFRGESRALFRLDRGPRRLRYDRMMIPGEMDRDARVISDGRRIRSVGCHEVDESICPSFAEDAVRIFLLWGLPEGIERIGRFYDSGRLVISGCSQEFKLVRREQIGAHQTARISIQRSVTLDSPGAGGTWTWEVSFWIDEATYLPVRRVEAHGGKCDHWTTTENFEEVRFDEEMPAERFRLPE